MKRFCVGFYRLDPRDQEYHFKDDKGRSPRALVEQVDGDKFYFVSIEGAVRFLTIHGMMGVSDIELQKLRARELP